MLSESEIKAYTQEIPEAIQQLYDRPPVTGSAPVETHEHDVIKCPWCGHIDRDAWERDDEGQDECGKCGKAFEWTRHATVTYTARPVISEPNAKLSG